MILFSFLQLYLASYPALLSAAIEKESRNPAGYQTVSETPSLFMQLKF